MLAAKVRHVSGPVSVHAFRIPRGELQHHDLLVFGDEHFSYDNQCQPCDRLEGCVQIAALIRELKAGALESRTTLDVYLEMPYVAPRGKRRSHVIAFLDGQMRDPSSRRRGEGYAGIFTKLYREFRGDLYEDAGRAKNPTVRFHYCDARSEPNVETFAVASPERVPWFHEHVNTADRMRELMRAFLFGASFANDMRALFGADAAVEPSLSEGVHKVAKQFRSLRPGQTKDALRAFLETRIEELIVTLSDDVGFGSIAAPARFFAKPDGDEWADRLRSARCQLYQNAFAVAMLLGVRVLIMDAYLLCRLVRFSTERAETAGGRSVVYVGDDHARMYARFLTEQMKLPPSLSHTRGAIPLSPASGTSRCLSLQP